MDEYAHGVYLDIIDELCKKLLEEDTEAEMDQAMVYTLHTEWIRNLEDIQSEGFRTEKTAARPRRPGRGGMHPPDEEGGAGHGAGHGYERGESESGSSLDAIEEGIEYYMICLFVKVAKSKNKWKCSFKQGFLNIGADDLPFSTAVGELEW